MQRVDNFTASLYNNPLPGPNSTIPGILTHGRMQRMYLISLTAEIILETLNHRIRFRNDGRSGFLAGGCTRDR